MLLRKSAVISELTAKHLTLTLENGQELKCLREELEPGAAEGAVYVVQIMPQNEAELTQQQLARTLLNQLLKDEADTA